MIRTRSNISIEEIRRMFIDNSIITMAHLQDTTAKSFLIDTSADK